MRLIRHPLALVFAGCWWLSASGWTQEPALPTGGASSGGSTSSPDSSGTPAASDPFGTGTPPSGTAPSGTGSSSFGSSLTSPASPGPGAASSFGAPTQQPTDAFGFPVPSTPPIVPGPNTFNLEPQPTNPATTGNSFYTGSYNAKPSAPVTFSAPSFYGQGPVSFVAGQGRLARPHFAYSGSMSFGFDDNVLSTPYNALGSKEVSEMVEISPFIPAQTVTLFVPPGPRSPIVLGPRPFVTLTIPAQKAVFKKVVLAPAVAPAKPVASFVARASADCQIQFASRKSVFTMDVNAGETYYPSRPNHQSDINGSLALTYLRRITPRVQFSANVNLAYLSQPNVALVNGPITNLGDYIHENSKFDLSYQWSKRFSTVSSVSYNTDIYTQKTSQSQSFNEFIFGTEGRYLWSPRLTIVGEVRYSVDQHGNQPADDSHSYFLLTGGELTLSRKLQASLRIGQELRSFDEGGKLRTAPYAESSLTYRYSRAGTVSWNSRIGFEEPPGPQITSTVLRSSINVAQAFSARTRGTIALSAAHSVNSDDAPGGTDTFVNSFQVDLGLSYMLNRRTTLTASYNFTNSLSDVAGTNYVRNQFFLGVQRSW